MHRHQLQTPYCGTFMEMGLGKTVVTCNTIVEVKKYEVDKVLVVAPLMVAENVWSDEIEKWDHLNHLTVSKILGDVETRTLALPRYTDADVYTINYDNLPWLIKTLSGKRWPFDMVVLDESSRVKNHESLRFTALTIAQPYIKRMILLSGTPMGNGYHDLWSQLFLLDSGERLGKKITHYRKKYFERNYSGWGYQLRESKFKQHIMNAIGDICVSMRQKDYLHLPERIERKYIIHMPAALEKQYENFKRDRVMEFLEAGKTITAVNAAVLYGKLLQFSNGAIYDNEQEKSWHEVHKLKLEALHEIVEDAAGSPVLCFYSFKSDYERIMKHCKAFKPIKLETKEDIKAWNRGEIRLAVCHPASAGHGLNLQAGGHRIVFFGHQWSSELRKQAIARLERKGQQNALILTDLVLRGTMDETVLRALARKDGDEVELMKAISALISGYDTRLIKSNRLNKYL